MVKAIIPNVKIEKIKEGGLIGGKITHGYSRLPIYSIWREMNRRCYSPSNCNYYKYGALGIGVYDEWKRDCDGGYGGFENFLKWAKENGYKEGLTLDRNNPYEDYSPHNCKWTNYTIQNTHLTISNKNTSGYVGISWIDHKGEIGWRARIKVNKKEIHLGTFPTKEKALKVRNDYILKNNLPHPVQKYISEDGYCKETYKDVFDNI